MSPRVADPDRRNQIVAAATQVLVERGLRATTVDAVAAAAGVAKGTVYLYFASKDELVAGVRAKYLDDYAAALRPPSPHASRKDVVTALVRGLFEFAHQHQRLHHVLFHEAGFSEVDAFVPVRERILELMVEVDFVLIDPETAASFVLHGIHGALVDHLHAPQAKRRSGAVIANVTDLVVKLMTP